MDFTFRPIDVWPGGKVTPPGQRGSPFKAGWSDTMNKLRAELRHLSAKNPVIMLAITEVDIRRDGLPRADARPSHPGVVIAFDSKYGPLKLPCDSCRDWQQNVRAIAYHLEHLRMSALYGVGCYGEQYRGWKQLPPVTGNGVPTMSIDEAIRFVMRQAGLVASIEGVKHNPDSYTAAYRTAAKRLHPDANGGISRPEWATLQAAHDVAKRWWTAADVRA